MLSSTAEFDGGGMFGTVRHADADAGSSSAARAAAASGLSDQEATATNSVVTEQSFEQGDCLVFLSHKHHSVGAVTGGTRKVLVIEMWDGPECRHATTWTWTWTWTWSMGMRVPIMSTESSQCPSSSVLLSHPRHASSASWLPGMIE